MAIFLGKRILRFTIFVVFSLVLLVTLGSYHKPTHDYVSNVLPSSFDLSSHLNFGGFGGKLSPAGGSDAEEQRLAVESKLEQGQGAADILEESEIDEGAKALKDSAESINKQLDLTKDVMNYIKPSFKNKGMRPKACFVSLVRNSEIGGMLDAIEQIQVRFNNKYNYDWVFLNDVEFTEEFKGRIREALPKVNVKFGLIPVEHWSYPEYIDQKKAAETRERMKDIIYGASESYRFMCHYQSGYFFRHPLMDEYDWYWRVEPGIKIHCDIDFDVFQWMQDHEKVYGFTISIHEYLSTIPTLWQATKKFFDKHPEYVNPNNLIDFVSDDGGETYNLCHFWSNFEVANLNLWRSPAYLEYFDYLDHDGGFFYERWGDAPVHSLAVAFMLPKDKVHYFPEIGYYHIPYSNCPIDVNLRKTLTCDCNPEDDFTFKGYSCGVQYFNAQGLTKPANWKDYAD